MEKYVGFGTSLDSEMATTASGGGRAAASAGGTNRAGGADVPAEKAALAVAASAARRGAACRFAGVLGEHRRVWHAIWDRCDVVIEGDDFAQRAVRFAIFQMVQAAPRHTDRVSIAARGLSGEGYKGHVFWDTETFVVPFFTFTLPEIARNLLGYRYHTLPAARRNAASKGYRGAMFAWESADTGEETTPSWGDPDPVTGERRRILCGDLEHHITADVAYAVWQYCLATADEEFLLQKGAEILIETGRFWASRASYNPALQAYEILHVIGPDEYHEDVNNNFYTNAMARWNVRAALATSDYLKALHPSEWTRLASATGVREEELAHMAEVAARLVGGRAMSGCPGIGSQWAAAGWEAPRKVAALGRLEAALAAPVPCGGTAGDAAAGDSGSSCSPSASLGPGPGGGVRSGPCYVPDRGHPGNCGPDPDCVLDPGQHGVCGPDTGCVPDPGHDGYRGPGPGHVPPCGGNGTEQTRVSFVIEQFDAFSHLADVTIPAGDGRFRPMEAIIGPEALARSRVVKQPDVLMALYLLEDAFRENVPRTVGIVGAGGTADGTGVADAGGSAGAAGGADATGVAADATGVAGAAGAPDATGLADGAGVADIAATAGAVGRVGAVGGARAVEVGGGTEFDDAAQTADGSRATGATEAADAAGIIGRIGAVGGIGDGDSAGAGPRRPELADEGPLGGVVIAGGPPGRGQAGGVLWRDLGRPGWRESRWEDVLRANWDYYEPRTDHGSSLSCAIHSVLASRLGLGEEAWRYFMRAAQIDLADAMGNAVNGVHMATQGGLWQAVVNGFAGVRMDMSTPRPREPKEYTSPSGRPPEDAVGLAPWSSSGFSVNPRLPAHWKSVSVPLAWRGTRVRMHISRPC
ncbi:MAG: hypothetical protein QME92_11680 [Bacillota bacterium]|nr:hypothetical protein [Bacillota bacterium]